MTREGREGLLRQAFEAMIRAPYRKEFEAVPWHVLERSETDQRFYRNADTRRRWEDFQAGARTAASLQEDEVGRG